jgi:hypothetical protein
MFEDEYRQIKSSLLTAKSAIKDVYLLFPPMATPLSGVDFIKRHTSGEIERIRRVNKFERFFYLFLLLCLIIKYYFF